LHNIQLTFKMSHILIIDDEQDILDILAYNLEKEGFEVTTSLDGVKGIELAKKILPDLIILDVMMPDTDGIEVCETLRKLPELSHTSICFLTARGEDYSQIAGLDAGADDYITKPVKPKVLVSRIKAIIRRNKGGITESTNEPSFIINRERYLVEKNGQSYHLPKKEFELLALLASRPDIVFERDVILEKVWGTDIVVGDRTIDVHVRKLREKLGDHHIKTVKGIGYKFEN
jgi:two-component system alkaline phosphatase synthesis response regulator PhoP